MEVKTELQQLKERRLHLQWDIDTIDYLIGEKISQLEKVKRSLFADPAKWDQHDEKRRQLINMRIHIFEYKEVIDARIAALEKQTG